MIEMNLILSKKYSGLETHVFWGKKKLVQLKIVYHKVSSILYSVQNLKIRSVEGQYIIL